MQNVNTNRWAWLRRLSPKAWGLGLAFLGTLAVPAMAAPAFPVTVKSTDGQPLNIPVPDAKATVLVFLSVDCPVANTYAPALRRFEEGYAEKGIAFVRVYPDPFQEVKAIAGHAESYGYQSTAVHDTDHALVVRSGVKVTPEVAVILPDGTVPYHGRIDDRYADFGKYRQQAQREDLRETLDAVLAKHTLEPRATKAIGCFIPDLPNNNEATNATAAGE